MRIKRQKKNHQYIIELILFSLLIKYERKKEILAKIKRLSYEKYIWNDFQMHGKKAKEDEWKWK